MPHLGVRRLSCRCVCRLASNRSLLCGRPARIHTSRCRRCQKTALLRQPRQGRIVCSPETVQLIFSRRQLLCYVAALGCGQISALQLCESLGA